MNSKLISILLCTLLLNQNIIFAKEINLNKNNNVKSYSRWAEESIKNAIELGLVPENLQFS